MDSSDLLEQEEAYHKLNAEIELRTRQLMKNMEAAMNKQYDSKHWPPDVLNDQRGSGLEDQSYYMARRSSTTDLYELGFSNSTAGSYKSSQWSGEKKGKNLIRHSKEKRMKDFSGIPLIPPCAKGMSAESLSRFLKAKGKLLQEELEQTKRELQMKAEECKKLHQDSKIKEEEKAKTSSEIVSLRDKVKKLEANTASLTEKLQMRDSENGLLKKEVEILKQDFKKIMLSTSGQETKLNKAKEEVEKLKQLVKQHELNEKEAREKFRKKNEEILNAARKLEKQKCELINVIKKQVILIENLKRQKGLLEAEGALNFTEKTFFKLLEGKLEDDRR